MQGGWEGGVRGSLSKLLVVKDTGCYVALWLGIAAKDTSSADRDREVKSPGFRRKGENSEFSETPEIDLFLQRFYRKSSI